MLLFTPFIPTSPFGCLYDIRLCISYPAGDDERFSFAVTRLVSVTGMGFILYVSPFSCRTSIGFNYFFPLFYSNVSIASDEKQKRVGFVRFWTRRWRDPSADASQIRVERSCSAALNRCRVTIGKEWVESSCLSKATNNIKILSTIRILIRLCAGLLPRKTGLPYVLH